MIGKRAAEHGVVAAVRYYIKQFPNLKENQARSQQFAKGGSTVDISAIDRTYIFIYMYITYI